MSFPPGYTWSFGSAFEEEPKGRKRGADASVIGDPTVRERNVQVCADEDSLAGDVGGLDRPGKAHLEQLVDEVDEPARVAPLVVVPAEDLDELGRASCRERVY